MHWCGGTLQVCVWAENADAAEEYADAHMQECQAELFGSEYDELEHSYDPDTECTYTVNCTCELNEEHEQWEYFCDPTQASFYPVLGTQT